MPVSSVPVIVSEDCPLVTVRKVVSGVVVKASDGVEVIMCVFVSRTFVVSSLIVSVTVIVGLDTMVLV